jgi:hypothetical protein
VWSVGETRKPTEEKLDVKKEKAAHGARNGFANFFAAEEGSLPTDYRAGIPQALRLMNGQHHYSIGRTIPVVLRETKSPAEAIGQLYLMTVSRRPRPEELQRLVAFAEKHDKKPEAYGDILWSLVNSTEFITNH